MRTYAEIMNDENWDYNIDRLDKVDRAVVKYTELAKYAPRLIELMENGMDGKQAVIWILDLWEDYEISDDTEAALYKIADPNNYYNDVYADWLECAGENPLKDGARRWA